MCLFFVPAIWVNIVKGTKRLSDCKAVALEFWRVQLYQKPEAISISSLPHPQLLDFFLI